MHRALHLDVLGNHDWQIKMKGGIAMEQILAMILFIVLLQGIANMSAR